MVAPSLEPNIPHTMTAPDETKRLLDGKECVHWRTLAKKVLILMGYLCEDLDAAEMHWLAADRLTFKAKDFSRPSLGDNETNI